MKSSNNDIAKYWDSVGHKYNSKWENGSMFWMSRQEINFIDKYSSSLNKDQADCLDVGSGNGRIIDNLLKIGFKKISSVDISGEMVSVLKRKYKDEKRVLSVKQVSSINDINSNYDLVTAIRVLKYNSDWQENIRHIINSLNKNGIMIFTMPNRASISVFAKYPIETYMTSASELTEYLEELPVEILSMTSKFRLPDFLYHSDLLSRIKFIATIEKLLDKLLPKLFAGRLFFVSVKKL